MCFSSFLQILYFSSFLLFFFSSNSITELVGVCAGVGRESGRVIGAEVKPLKVAATISSFLSILLFLHGGAAGEDSTTGKTHFLLPKQNHLIKIFNK